MPGRLSRSLAMAIPPLRTTASAMAEPMPPAAPVIRMTLSRKRPIGKLPVLRPPSIKYRRIHHGGRAGPFRREAVHLGKPLLQEHRAAVGTHAALRKARDLVRERLGGGT